MAPQASKVHTTPMPFFSRPVSAHADCRATQHTTSPQQRPRDTELLALLGTLIYL